MLIHFHKQATTTPKVRAAIQASDEPASVLAERFGTTEQTIYKWCHRDSVLDRSAPVADDTDPGTGSCRRRVAHNTASIVG
jgi:hypothetical protein